jgi:hypothetical protein
MKERLSHIKNKMDNEKIAAYYVWYSPKADLLYETEDATEDMLWLVAEVERLRIENHDLRSPRFGTRAPQQELMSSDTRI